MFLVYFGGRSPLWCRLKMSKEKFSAVKKTIFKNIFLNLNLAKNVQFNLKTVPVLKGRFVQDKGIMKVAHYVVRIFLLDIYPKDTFSF